MRASNAPVVGASRSQGIPPDGWAPYPERPQQVPCAYPGYDEARHDGRTREQPATVGRIRSAGTLVLNGDPAHLLMLPLFQNLRRNMCPADEACVTLDPASSKISSISGGLATPKALIFLNAIDQFENSRDATGSRISSIIPRCWGSAFIAA